MIDDEALHEVTADHVEACGWARAKHFQDALDKIVGISAEPISDTNARQRMRIVAAEALAS